jgi:hypothetical protein
LWRSNGESEAIKQLKKKGVTKSKSLKDNTIKAKLLGFVDYKEKKDLGFIIHQKGGGISARACWNASCAVNADRESRVSRTGYSTGLQMWFPSYFLFHKMLQVSFFIIRSGFF